MIKVLYLPLNSPEIAQTGMYDAFNSCGVDLLVFDFALRRTPAADTRRELIAIATSFKPHLIHMQLQFTTVIDSSTLIKIKEALPNTIITNWTGDIRPDAPQMFVEIGKSVDLSLISSVGQLQLYRSLIGPNVKYWQIGHNPKTFFNKNSQSFRWDAVFAASNYSTSHFPGQAQREQTVNVLNNELGSKFGLFGNGWRRDLQAKFVGYYDMNDIYAQSFSCISVSNFNDVSHYFSDRLLISLASGRPVVSLKFPGWESYFTDGKDILMASTPQEILEKVKWLKNNPVEANKIGLAGSAKVLSEHTYQSRAAELLNMVGL